jgi:hypothetical protein
MNTQYYKVMPIDVLPEESGYYGVLINSIDPPTNLWYNKYDNIFQFTNEYGDIVEVIVVGWLKPITLTLQELLQTEEGKEIIREVFNAAREETVYSDTSCGRGIGGQLMTSKPSYPTADDFINNN